MAKIIVKRELHTELARKLGRPATLLKIGAALCAVGALAQYACTAKPPFILLGAYLVLLALWYGHSSRADTRLIAESFHGLPDASLELEKLPEDYRCFYGLRFPCDGSDNTADMVVTGPTGVFLVQCCPQYGRPVEGSCDDKFWIRTRRFLPHISRYSLIPNPVRQARQLGFRLAYYLRSHGLPARVMNGVYLGCISAVPGITDIPQDTPVLHSRDSLRQWVLDGSHPLEPEQLRLINELLELL